MTHSQFKLIFHPLEIESKVIDSKVKSLKLLFKALIFFVYFNETFFGFSTQIKKVSLTTTGFLAFLRTSAGSFITNTHFGIISETLVKPCK